MLPVGDIRDTQCGFKGYSHVYAKYIAERQQMERFSFDLEHLLLVKLNGGNIIEIPIHYYKQDTTTVRPVHDSILFFKDLIKIYRHYKDGKYKVKHERNTIECE